MMFLKLFFAALLTSYSGAAYAQTYQWEVDDVEAAYFQDGDTPQIEIRMYGIDTPEKAQLCERANGSCWKCGERATAVLKGLLDHQEATYKFTGAVTYGRPVATIFVGQSDINLEMVRQGYAVVYDRYLRGAMKSKYLSVQADAQASGRGIWQGDFINPEKWRNGDRLSCE